MQDIEYRGEVCSVPRSTPKSTSIYQLNRYEPTRRDEGTSVQIWFCSVSTPDVKSSKNQHEMCRSWTLGRKDTVSTFASPPRASSSITGPFVCELSAQHEAGTRGNMYIQIRIANAAGTRKKKKIVGGGSNSIETRPTERDRISPIDTNGGLTTTSRWFDNAPYACVCVREGAVSQPGQ